MSDCLTAHAWTFTCARPQCLHSYELENDKHRRDSDQKITAFFSMPDNNPPQTKRATGLGDDGTSTSEDWNETSHIHVHVHVSRASAKHKTGYNSRWETEHTWVFYVDGEGMYC